MTRTKKQIAIVLTLVMTLCALSGLSLPASAANNIGDTDGDGKVTARDARFVLRVSARLETATEEQRASAEVDGDGKITAKDARIILRVSARLMSFPGKYTKGSFNGREYVNPWADLRIPLPFGWSADDAEVYAEWEQNGNVDCGFSCTSPYGDWFAVLFEECGDLSSEEEYREQQDEIAANIDAFSNLSHASAEIGGHEYLCSDYFYEYEDGDLVESLYVRMLGDRFVVIWIVSDSIGYNDSIISSFGQSDKSGYDREILSRIGREAQIFRSGKVYFEGAIFSEDGSDMPVVFASDGHNVQIYVTTGGFSFGIAVIDGTTYLLMPSTKMYIEASDRVLSALGLDSFDLTSISELTNEGLEDDSTQLRSYDVLINGKEGLCTEFDSPENGSITRLYTQGDTLVQCDTVNRATGAVVMTAVFKKVTDAIPRDMLTLKGYEKAPSTKAFLRGLLVN